MATTQQPYIETQPPAEELDPAPASYDPPTTDVVGGTSSDFPPQVDESKVPVVGQENPELAEEKSSKGFDEQVNPVHEDIKTHKGSYDRDVALADLEKERKLSFINAWEQNEKAKVENKSQKKLSDINSWENTQKAKIEAKLKKVEQALENKKAEYAEQMRNKAASVHKEAEEKRAMIEARRGEELLKTEEMAAKHRATGHVPKKSFGCFGG